MKIFLTKEEKESLAAKGSEIIERSIRIPVPEGTIIYRTGNSYLWDKIDRVWVYGNTERYIKDKKNVGRRKTDYKNNTQNIWSGGMWWDCYRQIDEWGTIGKMMQSGIKDPLFFQITELNANRIENNQVICKIKIKVRQ